MEDSCVHLGSRCVTRQWRGQRLVESARHFALASLTAAVLGCTGNSEGGLSSSAREAATSAPSSALDTASARAVAAAFYARYLDTRRGPRHSAPAWHAMLGEDETAFSEPLMVLLREERARWADAPEGVISTIDFDPFLGSQDPCDEYVQSDVVLRDGQVGVELRCSLADAPVEVVAELASIGGRWRIVDFYYPSISRRLTSILSK